MDPYLPLLIRRGFLFLTLGGLMTPHAFATNEIAVMTFNLRYASAPDGENNWQNGNQQPDRRQVVYQALTNYAPDLVGFQEAEQVQIDYLQALLPNHYAWESEGPSGGGGNEHAAIAYNTNVLHLLDRGVFSLGNQPGGGYWNATPGEPFDPWDLFPENTFAFPRIAVWAKFEWTATGQRFYFYTTHFDVFNGANDGESQLKSARLVADDAMIRSSRNPSSPLAICVGDFNGSQNDRAWKLFTGAITYDNITGDFTDSWWAAHGSWDQAGTFHGFGGGTQPGSARIDWILHRGGFETLESSIVTDAVLATVISPPGMRTQYPSDHYPVFARLRIPPPAPDYDRDGLPDADEMASSISRPADSDTDQDGLVDGLEDLNGNGQLEPGESDPSSPTPGAQLPTDLREHQMDGLLDFRSGFLAANGLELHWRFDGRYLYVSTQDAGEGNDHFIIVTRDPTLPVPGPFAKAGQVAAWDAFLADENDNGFSGWFDASQALITDTLLARSATYYQNGGRLEGVIDLTALFGAQFTNTFYLAAAPYGSEDGSPLIFSAQVPAGNGDGDLLGAAEFVAIDPGDADGDTLRDAADPDADGDDMPDAWELHAGILPQGAEDDEDGDEASNLHEYLACTDPTDATSHFYITGGIRSNGDVAVSWSAVYERAYTLDSLSTSGQVPEIWVPLVTKTQAATFPAKQTSVTAPLEGQNRLLRLSLVP